MGLPTWNWSETQPIAIEDVIRAVRLCLSEPETFAGSFDIGGPDVMTYKDMMQMTADEMGKTRWMFEVPFITLGPNGGHVISGNDYDLVVPSSVVCAMVHASINPLQARLANGAVS